MRKFTTGAILCLLLYANLLSAQVADTSRVLALVRSHATRLGLTPKDAAEAVISSAYTDAKTNIQYVYLQQTHAGIPVYNGIQTIIFRNNDVLYTSGHFTYELASKAGAARPSLSPASAVNAAALHLKLSAPGELQAAGEKNNGQSLLFASPIAKSPIETRLYWVVGEDGSVKLAWNVNIDVKGSSDWWNVRIDAQTGSVLEKDNWTVNEKHPEKNKPQPVTGKTVNETGSPFAPPPPTVTSAGYYVIPYPFESPKHRPFVLENQPWLKAGAGNNATTNGWHFDGANNYNVTRGNNVYAYLDLQNNNTPGTVNFPDTSSTAIPSLTFGTVPTFTQQPAIGVNRKAALTNLFYWNNIIHDVTYQYGFNEVSGNFQADNIGRGGLGNDYVQAEAQDASGTNNANFSTPSDGSRPRMQMYLWTGGPSLIVNAPASIAGSYSAEESNFSTANKLSATGPITGPAVYYNDANATTHEACLGAPSNSITGKIAIIMRGNCNFTDKVKFAQTAGAIAVIVINNVAGAPIVMGGADNTITIPAMMVSQSDGALLIAQLNNGLNVTLSPPLNIDGDFDNGIVVHEYGHGISNRLTGGPANSSCLGNAEQAGEGWSDYFALMLTTDWANTALTDGPKARPMGTFAFNQPNNGAGIRTFPYSTNTTVNPLTYANMATNTEVHFTGEIWAATLWDMTWGLIGQSNSIETNLYNSNSTAGNVVAMKLVMEGLRLQPCRPGFLDARDAILAADSILYNGAHRCTIWKAFAKRGMGVSAKQGSSSVATDQVAAFDVPSAVYLSKSSAPASIAPNGQQVITVNATCQCQVSSNTYTIRDTIPTGFTYVSSTGGVLNGNVVSFSGISFSAEQQTKTFNMTIQAANNGCFIDSSINDNRTVTVGGLTSSALSGTTNWAASNSRFKSGPSAWWATTPTTASDFALTSNAFTAGNLSILSFWHYYVTESTFDGGTVEITTNNGTSWIDASPYIIQNGYNVTMDPAAPWTTNQKAFSGVSYAQGSNQFINTVINLSPFSGQSVRVRFRMRTDAGNPGVADGWFIDDILQMNGCGGVVKVGLYNASNVKLDSSAYPVFIASNGTPTNIQSQPAASTVCAGGSTTFAVVASGGTLSYQWQVSTNGGSSYANIAGATSSVLSVTGITASMNGYLYRAIVDNGSNTATSAPAALTVGSATAGGTVSNVTACEGATAQFSSNATGTSLTYQWQVSTNGGTSYSNVAGATSSTLALNAITAAQNNSLYRVVATGSCGTANSSGGTLTVNSAPVVTITNPPAALCISDNSVSLTASQTGGTWSGSGVSSAGQFSPSALSAGSYTVTYTYTNSSGCVGTATASIAVNNCAQQTQPLNAPGAIYISSQKYDGNFTIHFRTSRYSRLSMRLYASDGKLVDQRMLNGLNYGVNYDIHMPQLAGDVYFLSLTDLPSGMEKTFRVMVAR